MQTGLYFGRYQLLLPVMRRQHKQLRSCGFFSVPMKRCYLWMVSHGTQNSRSDKTNKIVFYFQRSADDVIRLGMYCWKQMK